MAFTCGFYNGPNRMYNAEQLSSIFDGIISDGMYSNYRNSMIVIESENDNEVIVQPGRAWLMHTWSLVDANLPVEAPQSEVVLDRIDALVLDIDTEPEVRKNRFLWVQGTPASQDPQRPVLISTETHKQYPLCYVYRAAGTTSITQANITNAIGTSEFPFVTGIIDTINTDELLIQWEAQWEDFMANYVSDFSTWSAAQRTAFETWFESIRGILDEDAAGHLQNEIDALQNNVNTLQNEVDGVEELILPIGDSEAAPADTWTAMQVKNGDNVARLQMNAEGALRLFQSTDDGETWSQKEVGEKPTVRYNSETKFYEVLSNGLWYQDRYFDPTWNGVIYDAGTYDTKYFDELSGSYALQSNAIRVGFEHSAATGVTFNVGKIGDSLGGVSGKKLHITFSYEAGGGVNTEFGQGYAYFTAVATLTSPDNQITASQTMAKDVAVTKSASTNGAYPNGRQVSSGNNTIDIPLTQFTGVGPAKLSIAETMGSTYGRNPYAWFYLYIKKIWIS